MDSRKPSRPNKTRLHKFLAQCGIGSLRACERLIASGVVTVDGQVVTVQGCQVDPSVQQVAVKGEPVAAEQKVYIILHKPRDVLCTSADPRGRRTFKDLLPELPARVYTVGRLDRDSEGLLLVTNDGQLANRLTHPRYQVPKTYRVWVERELAAEEEKRLLSGILDAGERLRASEVRVVREAGQEPCYDVVLREGKNREVRRLFSALEVRVRRLQRRALGPLKLKGLGRGRWRALSEGEVRALRMATSSGD